MFLVMELIREYAPNSMDIDVCIQNMDIKIKEPEKCINSINIALGV